VHCRGLDAQGPSGHDRGARDLIPDRVEIGVDILNPVQVSAAAMDPGDLKREFAAVYDIQPDVPSVRNLAMRAALREANGG
jgi:hypothetical protein